MIRLELENYEDLRRQLGPAPVERALNIAIGRAARKTRTTVSQEVRKIYNVKARDVSRTVKLKRIRRGSNVAAALLEYTGPRLPLDKFGLRQRYVKSARGRRRGISVKVKKTGPRKIVRGAFAANVNGIKAFKREGAKRLPINRLTTVSLPQMVARQQVVDAAIERSGQELGVEFERALRVTLNRQALR